MHRAGLGGFQNFDASLFTPQVVEKRLVYMTPEWKNAFKYATTLADQLDLEEAIAGARRVGVRRAAHGFLASEAMKKYVWSETRVEGGKLFTGTLAHPPSNTGAFQNLGIEDIGGALGTPFAAPQFYKDSEVVAFKVPASEVAADERTRTGSRVSILGGIGGSVSRATICSLGQPNKAIVPRQTRASDRTMVGHAATELLVGAQIKTERIPG